MKIAIFILGIILGFTIAVVWRCLIVSSEAAEEEKKYWEKENETGK